MESELDAEMTGVNQIEKFRKWKLTGLGRAVSEAGGQVRPDQMKLRLMSYNILAPVYATQHQHLYVNTDPRWVDWGHRWRMIQRQVETYHPDIVTLQVRIPTLIIVMIVVMCYRRSSSQGFQFTILLTVTYSNVIYNPGFLRYFGLFLMFRGLLITVQF